jgi:hypothetical protein
MECMGADESEGGQGLRESLKQLLTA